MRLVHKKIIVFVFVALVILSLMCSGVGGKAYAATSLSGYSDVLDDLQKDETFNPDDYTAIDDDYSLQVIQIAESTAGELFIYVYQPAANVRELTATQLNMALSDDVSYTGLYDLTLLNGSGVFVKYKVAGLTVSSDTVRYYNITSIYRAWIDDVDEPTGNDNTINAVSYPVGKLFTATTESGGVMYALPVEFVTVTDKYVDYMRFPNGFANIYASFCDSHLIAFSCNYSMDNIISANIVFSHREVTDLGVKKYYGDWINENITIEEDETVSNPVGLWGESHTWKRISTVADFKEANPDLSDTLNMNLIGKQWVFQFYESEYTNTVTKRYVEVGEVTILRLAFKSNGKPYNLGVVDNKQSGDYIPGNKQKSLWQFFIEFCKWLESVTGLSYIVWIIIFFAVPICILLGVLSFFFPAIRVAFGVAFKGIWFVISAPYRLIRWIIKGGEE